MCSTDLPAALHLPALLRLARTVVPALCGQVQAAAPLLADSAPAQAQALADALATRHPQVGRAHWSLRAWSLLVWQPVYLGIIAAESGWSVTMARLWLRVEGDDVTSFALPADAVEAAADAITARQHAARQIRDTCATLLAAQNGALPISAETARRIEADCVLATLLRLQRAHRLAADNAALSALGDMWLGLLDRRGSSRYFSYESSPGCERLAVGRRLCCLEHRLPGASMCDTCPKLRPAERTARLVARDRRLALSDCALRSTA